MNDNRHFTKHLMLYSCVGVCTVLILGGWILSVRASFHDTKEKATAGTDQDSVYSQLNAALQESANFMEALEAKKQEQEKQELQTQLDALKKKTEEMNAKLEQLPSAEPVKPDTAPAEPAAEDKTPEKTNTVL